MNSPRGVTLEVDLEIWGDDPAIVALARAGRGAAWSKGDPVPAARGPRFKTGGWRLSSSMGRNDRLQDHVDALLATIEDSLSEVRDAAAKGRTVLSCAAYVWDGERPILNLSGDSLKRLLQLGVELDIDIFPFEPDRSEAGASPDPMPRPL